MALNGLTGAIEAKTAILESKGIYAPASKAQMQLFGGGIFGFGKSKANKQSTATTPTTRRTETNAGEKVKENQAGQNGGSK